MKAPHDKGGMGQGMNGHSPTYYTISSWIGLRARLEHTGTIRMKYFRKFIMFVVDSWRLVMDNRYNPLKYIPDPSLQTYFTLVLFTM